MRDAQIESPPLDEAQPHHQAQADRDAREQQRRRPRRAARYPEEVWSCARGHDAEHSVRRSTGTGRKLSAPWESPLRLSELVAAVLVHDHAAVWEPAAGAAGSG